jgi:hypothetical protein
MNIHNLLADFGAGLFLCNCIPHLAAGLQGMPFPSPFAKPPGKGDSSPVVNVLWGLFNFIVGLWLLSLAPVAFGLNEGFVAALAGALVLGIYVALHFGAVRKKRTQ